MLENFYTVTIIQKFIFWERHWYLIIIAQFSHLLNVISYSCYQIYLDVNRLLLYFVRFPSGLPPPYKHTLFLPYTFLHAPTHEHTLLTIKGLWPCFWSRRSQQVLANNVHIICTRVFQLYSFFFLRLLGFLFIWWSTFVLFWVLQALLSNDFLQEQCI